MIFSYLDPRALAVPGVDARAKKRQGQLGPLFLLTCSEPSKSQGREDATLKTGSQRAPTSCHHTSFLFDCVWSAAQRHMPPLPKINGASHALHVRSMFFSLLFISINWFLQPNNSPLRPPQSLEHRFLLISLITFNVAKFGFVVSSEAMVRSKKWASIIFEPRDTDSNIFIACVFEIDDNPFTVVAKLPPKQTGVM